MWEGGVGPQDQRRQRNDVSGVIMSVATEERETIAWAWPAVFGLLMLVVVTGVTYAAVWSWDQYTG